MGVPREPDIHEQYVDKALQLALTRSDIPLLAQQYYHAIPNGDMDAGGLDFVLPLNTGLGVLLQVKAGRETVGVLLKDGYIDFENSPARLTRKVSKRMARKAAVHQKKHPGVKAMLFVAQPKDSSEESLSECLDNIIREIKAITEEMIQYTCHEYKQYKNP
ncbi:MAG: hypothetical protein AAB885_02350 [Patescibacteria group bacterium]